MSHLLDDQGSVYERGFGEAWHPQQGLFGQTKDTNLIGQPNVRHDIFGRPVEARGFWGSGVQSADGRALYEPVTSSTDSSSSSMGDALAGAAAFVLVIIAFAAIAALASILVKLIEALVATYGELRRRYPRLMLTLKIGSAMTLIWSVLYLAGFGWQVQVSGTILVPGVWGWLWLTRHLPWVFLPINAAIIGAMLWLGAAVQTRAWEPTWSRLTHGLPLVGDLAIDLASLPMIVLLWRTAALRWPRVMRPINSFSAGLLLWFVLVRVWTGWQPWWEWWTGPVPSLHAATGWMILLLPVSLWAWSEGHSRWPIPFAAVNLALFGGVLSLSAYHTQGGWLPAWKHLTSGLPLASMPFLSIGLAPVTAWSWAKLTERWHRQLAIPNALITGGLLFLVVDRTRFLWSDTWDNFWGPVPSVVDPALALLLLPIVGLAWRAITLRMPPYRWVGRSALLGAVLWWLAQRTGPLWEGQWLALNVIGTVDLSLIAGITPVAVQTWLRLRRRWPRAAGIPSLAVLVIVMWLTSGWLLPRTETSFRIGYSLLPLMTAAGIWIMGRRPLIVLAVGALPCLAIALAVTTSPHESFSVALHIMGWLANQLIRIG